VERIRAELGATRPVKTVPKAGTKIEKKIRKPNKILIEIFSK
jgi:hypothetical protein